MTPVFNCGFEEGTEGSQWSFVGTGSISNTVSYHGIRSGRINPAAGAATATANMATSSNRFIIRCYVRFDTLPNATIRIIGNGLPTLVGIWYNSSDQKLYCGTSSSNLGATGITVVADDTLNKWYLLEIDINTSGTTWTVDGRVDQVALGQATLGGQVATTNNQVILGSTTSSTHSIYFDDVLVSYTGTDYPLGHGKSIGYIPNGDGTHTSTSTNIVKGTTAAPTGGGAITSATTDAWQWVARRPIGGGVGDATRLINHQTNASTEYVEVTFEDSIESVAPQAVEVLTADFQASTATGNFITRLNDNGTTGDIVNRGTVAGVTATRYATKQFASPPTGGSWNLNSSGAGSFQNIKARFGYSSDATPDQYWRGIIIEADYPWTHPGNSIVTMTGNDHSTGSSSTTNIPFPATTTNGGLAVMVVTSKYPADPPTTPSGWTLVGTTQGGAGASGADSGTVLMSLYTKECDGTEGGTTQAITLSNSATTGIVGAIYHFTKEDSLDVWDTPTWTGVAMNTASTTVNFTSDVIFNMNSGDFLLAVIGINTDLYTLSSGSFTIPGYSTGGPTANQIAELHWGSAGGDDFVMAQAGKAIIGGEKTTAPTFNWTASGSTANNPAGACMFIRISASPPAPAASSVKQLTLLGVG